MSFAQQTDTILAALRTTIGSSLLVDSASIAIKRTPECDLLTMPEVSATNYPLVALDVIDDTPGVARERESVKTMSVGVTVAMHVVVRYADVDAHATINHPKVLARKTAEALNAKIAADPDLSSGVVGEGVWQGGGQEIATREELHAQSLCAYTTVWRFDYGTDRP